MVRLAYPLLKLLLNGKQILPANGRAITNENQVEDIVGKFKSRYIEREVKKYYSKLDVAIEVLLLQENVHSARSNKVTS